MSLFTNTGVPTIPDATNDYDSETMQRMINSLRLFFNRLTATQQLNVATLNININELPTQASLSTLRSGDIYQDTTAGHVLKVKP